MDDVHAAGDKEALKSLVEELTKRGLILKEAKFYDWDEEVEYTHLRRRRRLSGGVRYIQPNPKHVEKCAELLGFWFQGQGARHAPDG